MSSLETQVWKTVLDNAGSTAAELGPKLKSVTKKELVTALNALLAKDLVKVSKTSAGQLVWKAVEISDAKAKNAMAGDDRMVFSAVEASGNQGIWSRTITTQTNLPNAVVTKILSKLLSSKQIKMVKSVKNPTRKMYMAAHIEPSVELTGGPWYTDFELDPTFIGFVKAACLKFVQKKSFPDFEDELPTAALYSTANTDRYPTLNDITRFIKNAKITDVNLLPEHIEEVMNTLVYDGLVEKLPGGGGGGSSKSKATSDSEDDRELIKKAKAKKRKHKRASSESASGSEEDASQKKKRRKKGADDSDEEDGKRSRSKSRRKRDKDDSDSDSDGGSKRGRKKKHSSDESDSDSDHSSKRRKKSRSRSRRSSATLSSDSDSASDRKSKKKKGKAREEEEEEDVDLDAAFGHLLGGGSVYRAVRQERVTLGWSEAPCGRCPQLEFCTDDGPVNPTGCMYYGDWLVQPLGD